MAGKPTHGLSYTPEYRAWQTMRLRCLNPMNVAYPSYGGRGITVCDRWKDDVRAFVADMGPKPSVRHELDRIDNDSGYSPENCRWVLRKVNDRNRRNNRFVEFRGERRTVAEWCEMFDIGRDTVAWRLRHGWSVERTLMTPARTKGRGNGEARAAIISANLLGETFATERVA